MIESDQELELAKGAALASVGAGDRRDQSALPATASGRIECCLGGSTRYVRDGLHSLCHRIGETLALRRTLQLPAAGCPLQSLFLYWARHVTIPQHK